MVRTIEKTVEIQPGGKVEVSDPDLPVGETARVIVQYGSATESSESLIGAFADDADLLDQIVDEAMRNRESRPWRAREPRAS